MSDDLPKLASQESQECGGKQQYATERIARDALRMSQKPKHQSHMNAYKCSFCEFWHVGHRPGAHKSKQLLKQRRGR